MFSKWFSQARRLARSFGAASCFIRSLISARAWSGSGLVIAKPKASLNTGKGENSQAPLQKRVWALALPAIGEQVFALVVGLSDTFLTGHLSTQAIAQLGYGRADAVAAVGVGATTVWVVLTLFFAVGVGVTALVARAVGAHDQAFSQKGPRRACSWGCWRVCSWQCWRCRWFMPSRMGWAWRERLRVLRQRFCVSSRWVCLGLASPTQPMRPCAAQATPAAP